MDTTPSPSVHSVPIRRTYLHVEPALAAVWMLTGAAYGCVLPYLAVYAARRGLSLTGIGLLSATAAGTSALLQPIVGRLVDRTGRRRALLAGTVLIGAAGFAGLGLVTAAPLIVACAALGVAGFYGSRVVVVAVTVNAVESAGHGSAVFARYRACPSFSFTIMAVGGGLLLGRISFATLFGAGALLYLLAGLCGLALPVRTPPQRPRPVATGQHAPSASARRVLVTLALMSLLFYVIGSSGDTYVPLLMRRLHGSFIAVGLAGTISAVVEIPLMVAIGSLADRGRRPLLLVAGLLALPLRYALYAFVHTPL